MRFSRLAFSFFAPSCLAVLGLLSVRCSSSGSSGTGAGDTTPDGGSPGKGPTKVDGSVPTPVPGPDDSGVWQAPDVGTPVDAGSPGQVDIHFVVHTDQSIQAISPYIYGVNDGSQAATTHATIVRNGGNRLTAYNWENNASNAGSDYQFENDDYLCSTATCVPNSDTAGAYMKAVVDQAKAAGAAALITVPVVDYVAADKTPAGDVRNSGSNYLTTRFKKNVAAKGSAFAYPPSTSDGNVYQDEMVSWLTGAEQGATIFFQLDNEPDLWSGTHAEVHPVPVTYAELAQRDLTYAKAIKAVVPDTLVFGPVNYGWAGYTTLQSATDSAADGDFLEWWLARCKPRRRAAASASSTISISTGTRRRPAAATASPTTASRPTRSRRASRHRDRSGTRRTPRRAGSPRTARWDRST